jgi:endo-1,4-beta-xylanase
MNSDAIMNLWTPGPPDGLLQHGRPEELTDSTADDQRRNRLYSGVSQPTFTIHPAPAKRVTGAAVVVFPGGGYRDIWIDKEGYDIARWLNQFGVTAAVVKYRTEPVSTVGHAPEDLRRQVMAASLTDAKRAMRLVRHRAGEWDVDPHRIGAIGFSAGGDLILRLVEQADAGNPDAADPVEWSSSRPDFSILLYPGVPEDLTGLRAGMGPVFIANASDDALTPPQGAVRLYQRLLEIQVPAELHMFREGGHGFGLGVPGGSVRNWMHLCEDWMRDLGYLAR